MAKNLEVDIDLSKEQREAIAAALSASLADTYTLYLKTHNFHWNVEGPMFATLHETFEEQYTELAEAVDEIAERIRALDMPAPGSFEQFQQLATIKGEKNVLPAMDMIVALVRDNEAAAKTAKKAFAVADEAGDEASADLMVQRMQTHEKVAWMLRSMTKAK